MFENHDDGAPGRAGRGEIWPILGLLAAAVLLYRVASVVTAAVVGVALRFWVPLAAVGAFAWWARRYRAAHPDRDGLPDRARTLSVFCVAVLAVWSLNHPGSSLGSRSGDSEQKRGPASSYTPPSQSGYSGSTDEGDVVEYDEPDPRDEPGDYDDYGGYDDYGCAGDCYDMDHDGRTSNDVDADGDGRYESNGYGNGW